MISIRGDRSERPNHAATPSFLRSPFINFPIPTPSRAQPVCYSEVMSTFTGSKANRNHEDGFVFSNVQSSRN
jgi:hypothetical protein